MKLADVLPKVAEVPDSVKPNAKHLNEIWSDMADLPKARKPNAEHLTRV